MSAEELRRQSEKVLPFPGQKAAQGRAQGSSGQVAVHRLEAERAVLGAALLGKEAAAWILAEVRPELFYREPHRVAFEAMLWCQERHGSVDAMLLTDRLRDTGNLKKCGGVEYLARLAQSVPVSANLLAHIEHLRDAFERREIASRARQAAQQAEDPNLDPQEGVQDLVKVAAETSSRRRQSFDDYEADGALLYQRHLGEQKQRAQQGRTLGTPFPELDEQVCGIPPGSYVMLAGRGGAGKSMFALYWMLHAAREQRLGCMFLGFEMRREENYLRILSAESGIDTKLLRTRKLTPEEWLKVEGADARLLGMPLKVHDEVRGLAAVQQLARSLHYQGWLDVIVVDHIHLVGYSGKSGYDKNESVSIALRDLALELDCTVIAVGQYSKGSTDGKDDRRPENEWLKGGAFMWQDPTHILHLHRPGGKAKADRRLEIIVGKNRHAPAEGVVQIAMIGEQARFESWNQQS